MATSQDAEPAVVSTWREPVNTASLVQPTTFIAETIVTRLTSAPSVQRALLSSAGPAAHRLSSPPFLDVSHHLLRPLRGLSPAVGAPPSEKPVVPTVEPAPPVDAAARTAGQGRATGNSPATGLDDLLASLRASGPVTPDAVLAALRAGALSAFRAAEPVPSPAPAAGGAQRPRSAAEVLALLRERGAAAFSDSESGGPGRPMAAPRHDPREQPLVFVRSRRPRPVVPPPAPPPTPGPAPRLPFAVGSDIATAAGIRSLASAHDPGAPLSAEQRARFEPFVGTALDEVRIHTDDVATSAAADLAADAFTLGTDIFVNRDRFDLSSRAGQALLAHELTHVRQQAETNRYQPLGPELTGEGAEREARAAERQVLRAAEGAPASGLSVGRHVRNYRSRDGHPLTPGERARLDRLSFKALEVCREIVATEVGHLPNQLIRSLQVSVDLDLDNLSDDQAAQIWGLALAERLREAVRQGAARPRLPTPPGGSAPLHKHRGIKGRGE